MAKIKKKSRLKKNRPIFKHYTYGSKNEKQEYFYCFHSEFLFRLSINSHYLTVSIDRERFNVQTEIERVDRALDYNTNKKLSAAKWLSQIRRVYKSELFTYIKQLID